VQRTYTFSDVVATLNGVVANDWSKFLRERLDGKVPITGGLEASGWKLVYKDEPSGYAKAQARGKRPSTPDYLYSLGFTVARDGKIAEVRWDSPAFNAGLALGTQIAAVNDIEFSTDALDDALKAAAADKTQPIRLLVKDLARYRVVLFDYHAGPRFPHLERIEGAPDLLTSIFMPRP
jgi:predicted metalloprotease with PDZ domain